jgi:hypothetical protein
LIINPIVIDFISKQCKRGLHENCHAKWQGLGLEVICCCECRHNKLGQALVAVEDHATNAIQSRHLIRSPSTGDNQIKCPTINLERM